MSSTTMPNNGARPLMSATPSVTQSISISFATSLIRCVEAAHAPTTLSIILSALTITTIGDGVFPLLYSSIPKLYPANFI